MFIKLEKMVHQISVLKRNIHEIKNLEKQISLNTLEKRKKFNKNGKNGDHYQKTQSTYFKIYGDVTVGVEEG